MVKFSRLQKVGFDTGNAWFSLESLIVDGIHKDLGMDSQNWFDCDRVSNTADSFKFNLGPINISVPYTNFFYEAGFNNKCGTYIGSNNNKGAQGWTPIPQRSLFCQGFGNRAYWYCSS